MNLHGFRTFELFGKFGSALVIALLVPAFAVETLAFDMNRIVGTQMRLIRYQATEYQRKVAAARVQTFLAAQRRAPAEPKPSAKPGSTAKTPKKAKTEEPKVAAKPKKQSRYLAVDTVKDKRSSPKAKKVIMIWDTHAESFVGNNIYDIESPPPVGSNTKFETYAAEYIGTGS